MALIPPRMLPIERLRTCAANLLVILCILENANGRLSVVFRTVCIPLSDMPIIKMASNRLERLNNIVRTKLRTTEGVMSKSMGSNGVAKVTGGAATIESVADIIERKLVM
jgi:hypothetical protein